MYAFLTTRPAVRTVAEEETSATEWLVKDAQEAAGKYEYGENSSVQNRII